MVHIETCSSWLGQDIDVITTLVRTKQDKGYMFKYSLSMMKDPRARANRTPEGGGHIWL